MARSREPDLPRASVRASDQLCSYDKDTEEGTATEGSSSELTFVSPVGWWDPLSPLESHRTQGSHA